MHVCIAYMSLCMIQVSGMTQTRLVQAKRIWSRQTRLASYAADQTGRAKRVIDV